tara:strand:+ start:8458 stop:8973 length:516 start_codon:yes stop_codon:yes gene_type:complete
MRMWLSEQYEQSMKALQPLHDKWLGLAYRERQFLSVAIVAFLVSSFYWMIWNPLHVAAEESQVQLTKQLNTLSDVKSMGNQIFTLSGQSGQRQSNLSSVASRSALEYGVSVVRMQPRGERLQLMLEPIPFNKLLKWLAFLVEKQGVSIDVLDIARTEISGVIQVNKLQLSR